MLPFVMFARARRKRNTASPPDAPTLSAITNTLNEGIYTVEWSEVAGATYTLEEDDNASFTTPTEAYSGGDLSLAVTGKTTGTYYYRVKATVGGLDSDWSSTQSTLAYTTYYVKTGGNNALDGLSPANAWETVAKVNGFAFADDDHIRFNKGDTWSNQQLVPTDGGSSGHPLFFGAYGTGAKPIINNGTTNDNAFYSNGHGYLTIDGLDIRGGTTSTLRCTDAHLTFQNCNTQGNGSSHGNGFNLTDGADYVTINACTIHDHLCIDSGGAGVYAYQAENLTVTNNTIYSNGQDTGDHGVYVKTCATALVRGNTFYSNTGNGVQVQDNTTNATVDKNVCYANGQDGIFVGILEAGNGTIVSNNLCYENAHSNIFIGTTAPDVKVYFNTCVNSTSYNGLHIGADGCDVRNNLVYQNIGSSSSNRSYRFQQDSVVVAAKWDYNAVKNDNSTDSYRVAVRSSPANGYTFAQWQAHANTPDAHGVNGDPSFVNAGTDNYHIQSGSSAKWTGVAIEGYETDLDGVTRHNAPSIGCYEYVA